MKDRNQDESKVIKMRRLTILELMMVLAILGILVAWIYQQFFVS